MPSPTETRGRDPLDHVICISIEHRLHIRLEEQRECQGEGEGGRVALLLDRVDRLPRHVERRGELSLRKPLSRTQLAHLVLHRATCLSSTLDTVPAPTRPVKDALQD